MGLSLPCSSLCFPPPWPPCSCPSACRPLSHRPRRERTHRPAPHPAERRGYVVFRTRQQSVRGVNGMYSLWCFAAVACVTFSGCVSLKAEKKQKEDRGMIGMCAEGGGPWGQKTGCTCAGELPVHSVAHSALTPPYVRQIARPLHTQTGADLFLNTYLSFFLWPRGTTVRSIQ